VLTIINERLELW